MIQAKKSPRADHNHAPTNGQLGKYRLLATLGQGGMGTVYLASSRGLGQFQKLHVVKELRQDLSWKDGSIAMFMDEARLAACLDHPNVVQTFEAGEHEGRYFLAMEYLDGQPLSALIERMQPQGGVPLSLHVHMLCDVLAGLQYAHELRDYDGSQLHVVHRDMSPQNVFITYHGQVKVVDFGVAKARNASALTTPGMFKGKFAYAAPEQVFGRPVDARADVFAVGVMLWEAIAGHRFADPLPTPEAFKARATGREPRIIDVVPTVEPLLADICNRALAVDPDARFSSAQEFRNELQDYLLLSGESVEDAQVAELIRTLFEAERVSIHAVIERAMKQNGASRSSVEALPFMRSSGDKEATLVADLSALSVLSQSTDDNQIRAHYEHSKITPVKHTPRVELALELHARRSQPPAKRLLVAVLGAVALSGAVGATALGLSRPSRAPAAPTSIAAPQPTAAVAVPIATPGAVLSVPAAAVPVAEQPSSAPSLAAATVTAARVRAARAAASTGPRPKRIAAAAERARGELGSIAAVSCSRERTTQHGQ